MWFLLLGLVVPHAPVLLPEVRGGTSPEGNRAATEPPDLTIVVSPHGTATGVYANARGNLNRFGVKGIEVDRPTDLSAAEALAREWGQPMLEDPCDHGIVVPLFAGSIPDAPLVACALTEITGPDGASVEQALEDALTLAAAVNRLALDRKVLFVASAHSSAALTPQAPLTLREEGLELDRRIRDALERDVGDLETIDAELWASGGACGAGPLTALGRLFPGSKAEVAWYEHPFGVGYMLALVA